jgi:dipeptidyl aminopeptidase/acylaminoacyl peptidase
MENAMSGEIKELIFAKYERNGWPAQVRPDIKPVAGWSQELIASMARPRAHVPSPDGQHIAFFWDIADSSDLYVMPSSGGWPSRLTFDRKPVAYWSDESPQWSPDGKWLAYTNEGHVWVISPQGGKPQKVSHFSSGAGSPRWLADSNRLVVNIEMEERARLVLTDRAGSWPRQLSQGSGHDHSAEVSADGTQMVYVHSPVEDFNRSDIMWLNIETGESKALTGIDKLQDSKPQFSPDGKFVAFISERPNFHELFLFDLATGQERQLSQLNRDIVEYAWSPDSKMLLCTVNNNGAFDLAVIDVQTSQIQSLRECDGVHTAPQFLDGHNISFEFEDWQNPPDIFRMDLSSGAISQLTFSKPPVFESLVQSKPEAISFTSFDGLEIPAFIYRPSNPNGAAIVYPHGGPTSQYILEWDGYAQYFVAKGYTWLAPNFRGSTGYGREFERANHNVWGVADTKDCLAAADYLATLDWIDASRLGIFGASYGSYMAVCALTYDEQHRFALGVAKYGDCNILSSWAQSDQIGREDLERMMGHPNSNRQAYREGSPIWRINEIEKPLFIAHGLLDDRVHPLQAEELVEGLKRHDKTFEYVTYADEGHGFLRRASKIDFYSGLERFFDWHLL